MSNRFVVIFSILVVMFIGYMIITTDNNSSDEVAGEPTNHIWSEGSTGVTLVEYADFECPACLNYFPVIQEIKQRYEDQITFQFRHYPLIEIHQNALLASRAAEAASRQGKFWEMHDKLFETQAQWSQSANASEMFENFAEEIEIDAEQFEQDLRSDEVNRAVQADRAEARNRGYGSTPTFELNGEQLTDARADIDYFIEIIETAIAEADSGSESNSQANQTPVARPEDNHESNQ